MANFSYVIDSSYNPFSMQEMLVPLTMYKEAYEKSEEQYMDLSDKADKFKYLSKNLPEGSAARKIYEGYAGELNKQAEDLAHNGLTMGNRRALTSLRRRYSGEIGRLALADEAMREEKKLRQTLNAQDSSRLYAEDNLNIDQFLDGNNPNLYNISGNELYTRGATAGKAASSRIFKTGDGGSTLGGYYRDWVQKMGYSAESINAFRQNASAIPELQAAADAILEERGVNQNLTGINLQRARQSVINGIIDGAVYQEQHSPTRDLGVMTAAEKSDAALRQQSLNLQAAAQRDSHAESLLRQEALKAKLNGGGANGSGSGSSRVPAYSKLSYISGGGSKYVDEVPGRAKKVNVEVKGGQYVVSVGSGNDKVELGKMDANGKFTLGKDLQGTDKYKNFAKQFGSGMSWYQTSHAYDPEYDNGNIKSLLQDIVETAHREGGTSYQNYNYYFEPDNVSYSNGGGGFYREPMSREYGTTSNEFLGDFTGGFGD